MIIQNPQQAATVLDTALQFQRYRRIATESILPSGAISLPAGLSTDIDAALQSLSREPNWIEIGRQLALLKISKAFKDVYFRRDKSDIEIVVVHWWGKGTLGLQTIETQMDAVWDIVRSLKPIIGKFELDPELKANITTIVDELEPKEEASAKAFRIIVSLLKAALTLADSNQGPTGVLLNLAYGGLTDETESQIALPPPLHRMTRSDLSLSWNPATLSVVAWDVSKQKVIGWPQPSSMDVSQLERNINHILSQEILRV